jgi:hypothetical protein
MLRTIDCSKFTVNGVTHTRAISILGEVGGGNMLRQGNSPGDLPAGASWSVASYHATVIQRDAELQRIRDGLEEVCRIVTGR